MLYFKKVTIQFFINFIWRHFIASLRNVTSSTQMVPFVVTGHKFLLFIKINVINYTILHVLN